VLSKAGCASLGSWSVASLKVAVYKLAACAGQVVVVERDHIRQASVQDRLNRIESQVGKVMEVNKADLLVVEDS